MYGELAAKSLKNIMSCLPIRKASYLIFFSRTNIVPWLKNTLWAQKMLQKHVESLTLKVYYVEVLRRLLYACVIMYIWVQLLKTLVPVLI